MRTHQRLPLLALMLSTLTLTVAAAPSCETAVTEAIQTSRGHDAQQVQFIAPKRTPSATPADADPHKGQGRYQGASGTMPFTYSCTVNPQTGDITGVVFSETGVTRRTAEPPWQADLSHLSPEACEAAAATEMRTKIPRLANLILASGSRQLKPAPNGHTYLHGQGSLERAAGMNPTAFIYRCELDTTSGHVLGLQTELLE